MKGYAILVLHCTFFLAAQCHHHIKRSDNGPVYDGLNSVLSEAHQHADIIAADLAQRMNQTYNLIKENVDQLKDNSSFTQKIEGLNSQDEVVQKCLKKHEVAIAQFMRKLGYTYDSCSADVKKEVNKLVAVIKEDIAIVKNATQLIEGIEDECLSGEEVNIAASALCVVTRIAEVQERLFEANQSVESFISKGVEDAKAYSTQKCEGIADLKKEFDRLYSGIDNCVKANQ